MDTKDRRITLAPPSPSSVRVTMDADDPRRLRLVGLGWHQVPTATPYAPVTVKAAR